MIIIVSSQILKARHGIFYPASLAVTKNQDKHAVHLIPGSKGLSFGQSTKGSDLYFQLKMQIPLRKENFPTFPKRPISIYHRKRARMNLHEI